MDTAPFGDALVHLVRDHFTWPRSNTSNTDLMDRMCSLIE